MTQYTCIDCGAGGASGERNSGPPTYHCHVCPGRSTLWPTELAKQYVAARKDAERYKKLQRWMASNVPEGWAEVEKLGGICAWMSYVDMDAALDALPVCNVGLCEVAS